MTDHQEFEQNPYQEYTDAVGRAEYLAQRGMLSRALSDRVAVNAAAMARRYPTMSSQLAGPVMISGIPFDSPSVMELAMRDQVKIEEDNWAVHQLKNASRWFFAGLDVPVRGYQQIGNTLVRLNRGESLGDAWDQSGSNIIGQAIINKRTNPDAPINLGQGLLPHSQLPWQEDGFTDAFRENLAGDMDRVEEEFTNTVAQFASEYGAPTTQQSQESLFSTPIYRTAGGRTYESVFTPVNLLMNPLVGVVNNPWTGEVLEPDDAAYQTISQWGQIGFDVVFDPANVPLLNLGRLRSARRYLPLQVADDAAYTAGTNGKRHWYRGASENWLSQSAQGQHLVEYLTANKSIAETMRVLDLGNVPDAAQIYKRITRATDPNEVTELLRPLLGTVVQETPTAHLGPGLWTPGSSGFARPIETIRTALSRTITGPDGVAYKMDNPLAQTIRKWGAITSDGVLDPTDPMGAMHIAHNYMKTLKVPADEIDDVLDVLADADGISLKMEEGGKGVRRAVSRRLIEDHGWVHADTVEVFGKWEGDQSLIRGYMTDNLGYPVYPRGSRTITGPLKDEPFQRGARASELAPGGEMPTAKLIPARRKATAPTDRTARATYAGVQETKSAAGAYELKYGRRTYQVTKVPHGKGVRWEVKGPHSGGATFPTLKAARAHVDETLRKLDESFAEGQDLVASVREKGVIEPVQVRLHEPSGQYHVTDGNKRVLAAEAAGIENIPVEILPSKNKIAGAGREADLVSKTDTLEVELIDDLRQVPGDPIYHTDPTIEAELAADLYILPPLRDLRRMTSPMRKLRRALSGGDLKIPAHQQAQWSQWLDTGMSAWRDGTLLSVKWFFNVIPDELARMAAAGLDSVFNHPFSYLAYAIGGKGDFTITGDYIMDGIRASDMGADFVRNMTDVAQFGYVGDVKSAPWIPISYGAPAYADAWARRVAHLWADEFTRRTLSMTPDEAYLFFTTTDEGREIVQRIVHRSRADRRLSKLGDPDILRNQIEVVNARAHQAAGGTWIGFDIDPKRPGQWIDSNGNVASAPKDWDGVTQWHIIRDGDPEIMSIIKTGHTTDKRRILAAATEASGRTEGLERVNALRKELKASDARWQKANKIAPGSAPSAPAMVRGQDPKLVARLDNHYRRIVDRMFGVLGRAPTMSLARSPMFRQAYWKEMSRAYVNATDEVRAAIDKWAEAGGMTGDFKRMLAEEMKVAGIKKLATVTDGGWDDVGLLNDWGKAVGLTEVKGLLYDMSHGHNVTDMSRNILVFAEAWWEILSRWSNMLFNPTHPRALYNIEKARQLGMAAQQNGWFSENEYGQTVFNFPSLGLTGLGERARHFGEDFAAGVVGEQPPTRIGPPGGRMGSQITLPQLASNPIVQLGEGGPGAIRNLLGPGMAPFIQLLLPPIQALLPPSWQQPFQYVTTGQYPIAEDLRLQGLNTLPASYRNALEVLVPEMASMDRRVAQKTAQALEILSHSGDYDMTRDGQRRLEQDAISMGRTLAMAKLLDSLFWVESPSYVPELLADSINHGQRQYVRAAALAQEHRFAEELFGDEQSADLYMMERYGFDPLQLAGVDVSASRVVEQRPVTSEAYAYSKTPEGEELYGKYPYLAFAVRPDQPGDQFYSPAWEAQFSNDTTITLTPLQQVGLLRNEAATMQFKEAQRQAEATIEERKAANPTGWKIDKKRIDNWLAQRNLDIQSQYAGWSRTTFGIDAHKDPVPDSPKFGDFAAELADMVVRDSTGKITGPDPIVEEANPDFAYFVAFVVDQFDQATEASVAHGAPRVTLEGKLRTQSGSENTWINSTADWAVRLQTAVGQNIGRYMNYHHAGGADTIGMQWVVNRFVSPLLSGANMEALFIVDTASGSPPVFQDKVATR